MIDQPQRSQIRQRNSFNVKHIDNWDDFKNCWKTVRFNDLLNNKDQMGLIQFWQREFQALEQENQKICILVPNQVQQTIRQEQNEETKSEKKKQEGQQNFKKSQVEPDQKEKNTQVAKKIQNDKKVNVQNEKANQKRGGNKNYQKNGGKKSIPKVKLKKNIFQIAMKLIGQNYKSLNYTYQSLFLGNDKQLLIYRSCSSIENYLSKYRLPNNFKDRFDILLKLGESIYDLKLKRNVAISSFDQIALEQIKQQYNSVISEFNQKMDAFKLYMTSILQDFKSKQKAQNIILLTVRSHLIPSLQQLVKSHGLYLTNRFYQCEYDQARDMTITKVFYQQLKGQIQQLQQQEERYIYIQRPKLPEPPKDIYEVQVVRVNLVNQTWVWRIHMPKCSKYNQYKGLFIRAPEGQGPAQLTIQVPDKVQTIDVQLYSYKVGKLIWQIYVYNDVGFTKSTQKIIYYSELAVPKKSSPLKNYHISVVGSSESGITLKQKPQQTVSAITKIPHKCKQISIYNAAIICDSQGSCAGWGQMYYTEQQQDQSNLTQQQIQLNINSHLKRESPFLVLSHKYIRKVSCGYGYTLMLTSLGVIWSFGFNKYGQLGLGHFQSTVRTIEPTQICKFTGQAGAFVVDICATTKGSSFAIDDNGKLYRWGYSQVEQTHLPIIDRFNTVINYQTGDVLYKNATPICVGKLYINGQVRQIEAGDDQFYAVTKRGDLYGWGKVQMLGCGVLKDLNERLILDIINPLEIRNDVEYISTNINHTVALTKANRILAWGRAPYFSNKLQGYYTKPVDITDQFGQDMPVIKIKAGTNYTIALKKDRSIIIVGSQTILKVSQGSFTGKIVDINCSKYEELFAVLIDEE